MKIIYTILDKNKDELLKILKKQGKELMKSEDKAELQKIQLIKNKEISEIEIQGDKKVLNQAKKELKNLGYKLKILKKEKSRHFIWKNVKIKLYKTNLNQYKIELAIDSKKKQGFDKEVYLKIENKAKELGIKSIFNKFKI